MKKYLKISVIIPLYVICDRFFSDFKKFDLVKYPNFEVLVVCDKQVNLPKLSKVKTKLIITGLKNSGPAEKRDLGLKQAEGEICAFIDDDAYPDPDWLKSAIKEFDDLSIAAVAGPGLTPSEDDYWEQLTGLVYSSFFCGGFAQYRFVKGKRMFVTDYPAYNLLVRTDILKKVGGYGSYFYGGEDTFLCLKLIKAGYKILYDPMVIIYHHRRPLFFGYLKQIANIGKHRGYFAKKFPETSRQLEYFIPSLLVAGFFFMLLASFFNFTIFLIFMSMLLFFLFLGFSSVVTKGGVVKSFFVSIAIILTHLTYGSFFIKGLLIKNLSR